MVVSWVGNKGRTANLQGSQAVLGFRDGSGKVSVGSRIRLLEGKAKTRQTGYQGHQSQQEKVNKLPES